LIYCPFFLDHYSNSQLMTKELMRTLAAHAANNLRVLNQMAAELLAVAAQRNLPRIDESLFFELFTPTGTKSRRKQRA
jgi:general secretion pathway protein A